MAAIELDNVHLEYPLRDSLSLKEYLLTRVFGQPERSRPRTIHALRGVTLRIGLGERVAIVGANGAGKSTLLRTIAGVYPASAGRVHVAGSICSLFDIFLGFEPEASGWDNLAFRSYLFGCRPEEVKAKLQAMGDFTELGPFLDLPARCYSSGMITRLVFSVATSMEPEILLLDEFLSAGDLAFQEKAERRMRDFQKRAKIVVMVGHNLTQLAEQCERAVWLDRGVVRGDGPAKEVIGRYCDAVRERSAA
jgi:ABC-type polysaccharide/polyol phosphate transport system ATPase subunit